MNEEYWSTSVFSPIYFFSHAGVSSTSHSEATAFYEQPATAPMTRFDIIAQRKWKRLPPSLETSVFYSAMPSDV